MDCYGEMKSPLLSRGLPTAEAIRHLKAGDFQKPWPRWAIRAAARLLNIFFPVRSTRQFMAAMEGTGFVVTLAPLMEDGWIWGRLARGQAELRRYDPAMSELISNSEWLRELKFENGELRCDYGHGLENLILHQIQKNLQQQPQLQAKFWQSFHRGFRHRLVPRSNDAKAVRIYWSIPLILKTGKQSGLKSFASEISD
jgi:hypothetical protein